jgi:hypothetical protein
LREGEYTDTQIARWSHMLIFIFKLLFLFKKQKSYAISTLSVCHSYQLLNQILRNFVCTSRHLGPHQRNTSEFPLINLCACMCIPLSLLGNGSVKTLPRQRRHAMTEELLEASFSLRSMSYQRKVSE